MLLQLKISKPEEQDREDIQLQLQWLEKDRKIETEDTPIGIIMYACKEKVDIQLFEFFEDTIRTMTYLDELPPKNNLLALLNSIVEELSEL